MKDKDFKKYLKEIEPRVDWLIENKKHLEAFLLIVVLLEKESQCIIELIEKRINLKMKKGKVSYNIKKNVRELTLGQLINRFSIYYSDNKILPKLETINKLRIKCVHKLFLNKIVNLEKNIINKFPDFYKLLYDILSIEITLLKE